MYSDKNVQNKCKKSSKHFVRIEADYEYELLKYRKYIFTYPKLMR